jgi:carbon monoxide dehydrogenase subunit G
MDFIGEYRFNASALEVWEALNDPEVLRRTIPGCDVMDRITPTDFAGHLKVKVGPLHATFSGKITLSELDPPHRYRISVEARAPIAGSAAGSAAVQLADHPEGALLYYQAETEIGGRLASFGAKLMHGAATKYADKFFARFAAAMEERNVERKAAQTGTG